MLPKIAPTAILGDPRKAMVIEDTSSGSVVAKENRTAPAQARLSPQLSPNSPLMRLITSPATSTTTAETAK
jgi:hypothetical protein